MVSVNEWTGNGIGTLDHFSVFLGRDYLCLRWHDARFPIAEPKRQVLPRGKLWNSRVGFDSKQRKVIVNQDLMS